MMCNFQFQKKPPEDDKPKPKLERKTSIPLLDMEMQNVHIETGKNLSQNSEQTILYKIYIIFQR